MRRNFAIMSNSSLANFRLRAVRRSQHHDNLMNAAIPEQRNTGRALLNYARRVIDFHCDHPFRDTR